MKKLISLLFIGATTVAFGQKNKTPQMAPEFTPGYYVTAKGDTIKGGIQSNPDNEGDLYTTILFKADKSPKPVVITTKKAKAYGFGDNHFVLVPGEGRNEVYMRYLAKGRLNFLVFKYASSYAGAPIVAEEYYIQDSKADDDNAALRELKKLNEKFYKKELKPYMKDQAMIWSDLDKFVFKAEAIANSVREYNRMYE